jgi:hypothetical protein
MPSLCQANTNEPFVMLQAIDVAIKKSYQYAAVYHFDPGKIIVTICKYCGASSNMSSI